MSDNFEDLIDQYWDEESVNNKIEEDAKEEIEEHGVYFDSRLDSPFNIEDEISINDFVNKYLRIKGNFKKFRHFELKNLNCPYVIGVANELADNDPELVTDKKYLLIVIDANGNRGTYLNPVLAHEFFEYDLSVAKKRLNKRTFNHFENFSHEYELYKNEYESYQEFFDFVKKIKKDRKFRNIEKDGNYEGDDINGKHKRK